MNFLFVFIGGGIGSVLRFCISLFISKIAINLPFATLLANFISCSIYASAIYIYQQKDFIPGAYKYVLLIGVCGGLSTFSTFSYETVELFKQGSYSFALLNIIGNCLLCFGVFLYLKTKYIITIQ